MRGSPRILFDGGLAGVRHMLQQLRLRAEHVAVMEVWLLGHRLWLGCRREDLLSHLAASFQGGDGLLREVGALGPPAAGHVLIEQVLALQRLDFRLLRLARVPSWPATLRRRLDLGLGRPRLSAWRCAVILLDERSIRGGPLPARGFSLRELPAWALDPPSLLRERRVRPGVRWWLIVRPQDRVRAPLPQP